MKTTLIVTVLNEEDTIRSFIESILLQELPPNEVVIVDGGSIDNTFDILKEFVPDFKNIAEYKYLQKRGSRSVGRNEAIKQSKGEIILSSDSGCILDKKWASEIIRPFIDKNTDVVAGYYKGLWKNIFQKSLIPYVLVMSDKTGPAFLPAARSMAFKKTVWIKTGGFDEKLSHNEDYAFAIKLKKNNAKIVFCKSAIVYWQPRENLRTSFIMFYRFALGDIESGIFRPKMILIFLRYLIALLWLVLGFIYASDVMLSMFLLFFIIYLLWAVYKNYKYVMAFGALYYLPLLQLTSDLAVLTGTVVGLRNIVIKNLKAQII